MSREALIGIGAFALAFVAMLADHWLGDEPGNDDPGAFYVSGALPVLAGALYAIQGGATPDAD